MLYAALYFSMPTSVAARFARFALERSPVGSRASVGPSFSARASLMIDITRYLVTCILHEQITTKPFSNILRLTQWTGRVEVVQRNLR